ncbi:hypothetical protein PZB74_02310 [Porifericola rhodea]|uniref:DUF6660 family protein n=1 Tax=Porifericola rhodea TaxID=930972 RepID=UPI00266573AA|nr:DUF6660 family protein [Porifericola rhodea]WKN32187.1 hypothetical protein PZB74_02310 [Porifericola rhodea]
MRLIATILSFYVLLLAFAPCGDEVSHEEGAAEEVSIVQEEVQEEYDLCLDFCTPFCHCHCCHSHVTFFDSVWPGYLDIPYGDLLTHYSEQKEALFPYSIFQPPRL